PCSAWLWLGSRTSLSSPTRHCGRWRARRGASATGRRLSMSGPIGRACRPGPRDRRTTMQRDRNSALRPAAPVLRSAHGATAMTLVARLPRATHRPLPLGRIGKIALAFAIVSGLITHGYHLFQYPLYDTDEGIYVERAWAVIREDRLSPQTY